MKKSDSETVYCCACQPYLRFDPPSAAERLSEHYQIGKHQLQYRSGGKVVRVDA